jgi:hypothetical protein
VPPRPCHHRQSPRDIGRAGATPAAGDHPWGHGDLPRVCLSGGATISNSVTSACCGQGKTDTPLNLLYLSTQFLWWQAVTAIIGGRSSHTLRHNSRGTWRHSEGSRNVDTTAIRCAFSPLRPCGSSPADVHDCPRGVAPLRHRLAIKDTPGASTGEATTPSPPHPMGCAAHPSILFSPPGHGFSTLDAHWKPLI